MTFDLRVRNVFKKTWEIGHVLFNFNLAFKSQTIVIFGIMKYMEAFHMRHTLSIIICFTGRNSFKMALTILTSDIHVVNLIYRFLLKNPNFV